MPEFPELLTVEETAQCLRLRPWAVYGAIKRGSISAFRLPNRQLRIRRTDLDSLIENGRIGAPS